MNRIFAVRPSFGFFDDRGGPNGFAIPKAYEQKGKDGTVLLGLNLLKMLQQENDAAHLSLIGVMAHEWGHIRQFKEGLKVDWSVKYELSADYMAGWYLARTRPKITEVEQTVGELFSRLGDTDFDNPDHHGTATQRSKVLLFAYGAYPWDGQETQSPEPDVRSALHNGLAITN